jgi:uncharacterized repeat protein (TIGR01451 family)
MRTLLQPPAKIPCCSTSIKKIAAGKSTVSKGMNRLTSSKIILSLMIFLLSVIAPFTSQAQTTPNEAIWNGFGYSLKKVVSNTSIQSGVNFSYTILFTAPAGATTVTIQDQIPASLVVVNVPTPAIVNGVTPVVSTTGPIGSQVVTYTLTSLPPGSPASGSFTIVVKFPEGTTCNGAVARNRAGIRVGQEWFYTPYVSSSATAIDPWVISKSILSGPVVNPNGGNCGYQMNTNTTVIYRLVVMKANGYWGNVVGQMNMNSASVTDIFPVGAVVGALPPGVLISGNTITWTPNAGLLDAANAWAYYYVDIPVTYPPGPFPNGSFVYNQATLTGTICQQPATHQSNQTCIEVANVVPAPGAYFQKWVNVQNRVPGCPGSYTIYFTNNGNVPLSAFNIDDVIPSGVAVTSVQFYYASPTTTVNITANGGANTLVTGLNTNSWSSGAIGYPVNNIQFAMTGSLPVGQYLYIVINFTINPNPVGTVVNNCATFNGLANGLTLPQTCASFTVAAAQPDPCLVKDICAPQTDYEPGDIIRMRLRVQNIGSAALTGATIQDVLNPSFTYLGNESYFISNSYSPACGPGIPSGTTAWTGVTPNHSGNNLSWNLPSIPSACQFFAVAYCGYYGTWGLDYYYIEFDVQVDGSALPGVTPNNYNISGGNLPATVTSNTINVLIVAKFGQEVEKQVSTDNGVTFASTGTVAPGSTAKFRLNYKNTSNVPVSTINLVDLLAKDAGPLNDWLILNRSTSRGSQFDITYGANPATSIAPPGLPPVPAINFAAGENICLPPFGITIGCTGTSWLPSPSTENVWFGYGTYSLLSGITLREDFDVNIPLTANTQETVCNDFAALSTANFLLNGNPTAVALTPIAAAPICLTVGNTPDPNCCDSIRVSQSYGSTGVIGCCAKIESTCDVEKIEVTVTNGAISSATWNCGPIPAGYVGQSNYTFVANGCAATLYTCFDAIQTGSVGITYTITLTNGEVCVKEFKLDCEATAVNCCDSIRVSNYSDPTQAGCCLKLESKCEIKAVNISLVNGTFSSATSSCGAMAPGYVGQSNWTFAPGNCAPVDLITCVTAQQAGIVIANYTIYFANGDSCTKVLDLDCEVKVDCCDSINVEQVQNSDGTLGCCTRIESKCDVEKIEVTVNNGTISSASWNCGPIPAGYAGQSAHTFVANGCATDLVLCFDAIQSGWVTVTYTITLTNGEVCEKTIRIECKADEKCCDGVKVDKYADATGQGCCLKLESKCEIKAVNISLTNGTFSSATSSCGTLAPGYVGQSSWTFAPGNCTPVDLITCIDAIQTGIVIANYTIYFANGDSCTKVLDLDCEAKVDCCDSINVEQVHNSDGTLGCCTRIESKCDVEKITVSVNNGTISSASWNCGPIPAGFVGQSTHTFVANGCAADLVLCFDAIQTGWVTVTYTITLTNGEVCEKTIRIECKADEKCCDGVKVEKYADATGSGCCLKLESKCEIKAVNISLTNGTFSSATSSCGTLAPGYVGQSNWTFAPGNCSPVDLITCVDAIQTGIVIANYTIYFANGDSCKKVMDLDCVATDDDCCALVDFKLKQKWPFKTQTGTFNITNLNPSSPICSVTISASPSATFAPGSLIVDGFASGQSWNSTSIPVTGTLTNPAVNTLSFSMSGNYKGVITICVIKCDGTRCCFDFKWNKNPLTDVDISLEQLDIKDKIVAVSVNPVVTDPIKAGVKYISFGFSDEKEVENSVAEFFAISASHHAGDDYPESLAPTVAAYMGKFNAFFELPQPVSSGRDLGAFNLVFAGKLPKLGCTLFDQEGNIIFSGDIDVSVNDTVITTIGGSIPTKSGMFEFINVYPNPSSDGLFTLTYATGDQNDVEISVVNAAGQVMEKVTQKIGHPGIHKQAIDTRGYAAGVYRMVISSGGKILSKSAVKN